MQDCEAETVKWIVIKVLEEMEIGETFTGAEFKRRVVERCPEYKDKYIASILRPIFDYNKSNTKNIAVECIDKAASLYRTVPPFIYDKNHSLEKKVLITESRFKELCEKEKWFDKHTAEINKWKNAEQQEFCFE